MSTKIITAAVALMCLACLAWSPAARAAQSVLEVTGDASTNSLDQATTLGSAELKLKGKGKDSGAGKLVCGVLGQVQARNADGSFTFRHTLACDDHSLFILTTHTVIVVQSGCTPPRSGFVGTFQETSTLVGVDGPFSGSTGIVSIDGTIDCGFNDMKVTGSITRP